MQVWPKPLNSGLPNLVTRIQIRCCMVKCKAHFDTLHNLGYTHEYDRQTDKHILLANITLHYIVWPKTGQINKTQERDLFTKPKYGLKLAIVVAKI